MRHCKYGLIVFTDELMYEICNFKFHMQVVKLDLSIVLGRKEPWDNYVQSP